MQRLRRIVRDDATDKQRTSLSILIAHELRLRNLPCQAGKVGDERLAQSVLVVTQHRVGTCQRGAKEGHFQNCLRRGGRVQMSETAFNAVQQQEEMHQFAVVSNQSCPTARADAS